MELAGLLKKVDYKQIQGASINGVCVSGIAYDSRKVQEGSLFVCISGAVSDGHAFAKDAVSKSAVVIVTEKPVDVPEYVIVLGARVNGTKVSRNLKYRLDAALGYIKDNPLCKVIVSGGQGKGEHITEGQAMRDYLINKGIEPERVIKEEISVNTGENLKYSMDIIGNKSAKVVIVSNNFHIYRAVKIAEKQVYKNVSGAGAKTVAFTLPNCYLREAFAVIKYKICGQI